MSAPAPIKAYRTNPANASGTLIDGEGKWAKVTRDMLWAPNCRTKQPYYFVEKNATIQIIPRIIAV